jgi:hypothetical protein
MAYLLLLAFVCCASFTVLLSSQTSPKRNIALVLGFGFLSLSLLMQLVLGFHLDESAAKLFYLSRFVLVPAWLGLAVWFPRLEPTRQKKLAATLALVSSAGLILIGNTAITRATDWYTPELPIYPQISDLLATNRPTRWLAGSLSAAGLAALAIGSLYTATKLRIWPRAIPVLAAIVLLALPILWPPAAWSPAGYMLEALPVFLLFFGFSWLAEKRTR